MDEFRFYPEGILKDVLEEGVKGGLPFSYEVYFTSERVMLIYGLLPKSHRDMYESFCREVPEWKIDYEIARLAKAQFAWGLPALLEDFKNRLLSKTANQEEVSKTSDTQDRTQYVDGTQAVNAEDMTSHLLRPRA